MSQMLTQVQPAVNDPIAEYLSFQAHVLIPSTADQTDVRIQNGNKLLARLAEALPEPVELADHDYPVLIAPNGVIFAAAGCKDLLQLRLPRPFPEVDLTVGVLPAEEIGPDWCYCNPRGEPEANLEAWIRLAYEFAMAVSEGGNEEEGAPHRVIWPQRLSA